MAPEVDRRTAVVGIAAISTLGLAALAGCDSSGSSRKPSPTPRTSGPAIRSPSAADALDAALRDRALADERQLLAACAAPPGMEPFATLRAVHADHLRVLSGTSPAPPAAAAKAPAAAQLSALERAAAAARRADCVHASAAQAPLLASLAASGNVAVALLLP